MQGGENVDSVATPLEVGQKQEHRTSCCGGPPGRPLHRKVDAGPFPLGGPSPGALSQGVSVVFNYNSKRSSERILSVGN